MNTFAYNSFDLQKPLSVWFSSLKSAIPVFITKTLQVNYFVVIFSDSKCDVSPSSSHVLVSAIQISCALLVSLFAWDYNNAGMSS